MTPVILVPGLPAGGRCEGAPDTSSTGQIDSARGIVTARGITHEHLPEELALMAAISREEVAHLARLSRLAVTEEELDHVRRPARCDPAGGRPGRRGRRGGHPADLALGAADQRAARGRGRADARALPADEALAGAPDSRPSRHGSGCRGSWTRRS